MWKADTRWKKKFCFFFFLFSAFISKGGCGLNTLFQKQFIRLGFILTAENNLENKKIRQALHGLSHA